MLGLVTLLLIGLLLALLASAWAVADRLTRPPRRTYAWAVSRKAPGDPGELRTPRAFESWRHKVQGGRLRGMELPAWDIVGDDPTGPILIFTPGWGDSRIGALARLDAVAPRCSRVIVWEQPGQGEAPGRCRLGAHEHEALLEIVDALGEQAADRRVVLYGWSMGAGTSIVAAGLRPNDSRIAGVIAEAPYRFPWTPAHRVLDLAGLPHRLNAPIAFAALGLLFGVGPTWRGFDRAERARRLTMPLLVLHGSLDEICPIEDGEAVANAAPRGELARIPDAGHNNLWIDEQIRGVCADVVREFIERACLASPIAAASRA